ncbi:hypothetical protein [Myxosarcina sp. GI1(2024)]
MYGGEESVQSLIATSREAKASYEATGELSLVPAASDTDPNAVMQQAPYYTDPERGAIPEYVNQFKLASWEGWLTYNAIATADELDKPVKIIYSEDAAIPQGAKEFYNRLTVEKQELWLENTTQFDFYNSPEVVSNTSDAVAVYFEQIL